MVTPLPTSDTIARMITQLLGARDDGVRAGSVVGPAVLRRFWCCPEWIDDLYAVEQLPVLQILGEQQLALR